MCQSKKYSGFFYSLGRPILANIVSSIHDRLKPIFLWTNVCDDRKYNNVDPFVLRIIHLLKSL